MDPGSWIQDPGCCIQDPESKILDHGSCIQDIGSRILKPDLHSLPRPLELSHDVFLTFSWTSQLKHLLLRAILASNLPKKLSKVCVLAERPKKKSTKTVYRSVTFHKIIEKRWSVTPKHTSPAPHPDNPDNPHNPPDPVHRLQLGTSPTRAGGQDDASLNKHPQIRRLIFMTSKNQTCLPMYPGAQLADSLCLRASEPPSYP